MARGDYIEVIYRLPTGSDKVKIQAMGVGGSVVASGFTERGDFVLVEELDRNSSPLKTARFAKAEVIAVTQGHEMIRTPRMKVVKT